MKVSAVIPCYNSAATIERAVKSCAQQSYAVAQIIVVNDGSIDDSLQVLEKLKKVYNTLEVINQKNQGVCVARNNGITAATGDYILMLDADDFFDQSFVKKALTLFIENSTHGAVISGYRKIRNGVPSKEHFFKPLDLASCLYNNGMHACALFPKKALVQAGLYDPAMQYAHEDWDLNIRLLKNGFTVGIIEQALFNYTQTQDSRSSITREQDLSMRMLMYQKYKSDYLTHHQDIYYSLQSELLQLRKENKEIRNSASYKWSRKLVNLYTAFKTK
ncbi:beta-1,3-glucosyltransferase [Nonlabens ulvanivorans]|nr:glycosyltransferase family A protein [Nonlabens ulvanivorans]GAK93156.1 beta-1,3-glucosyltransferase [Nonlabens ulvanivorans]